MEEVDDESFRLAGIAAALAIAVVALLFALSTEGPQQPPAVSADEPEDVEPAPVELYVLVEDTQYIPGDLTSYTSINRLDLPTVFAAGGSDNMPYRWLVVSEDLLDQLDAVSDPYLYDQLWSAVLDQGYGFVALDTYSNEVAEVLDLIIPRSEEALNAPEGVEFVGSLIRRYRESIGGADPCPVRSGFATEHVFTIGATYDPDDESVPPDYSGPQYGLLQHMSGQLTNTTQESHPDPANFMEQGDAKYLGSVTHQHIWFGRLSSEPDWWTCPYGEINVTTHAWAAASEDMYQCLPPGQMPPGPQTPTPEPKHYVWATAHQMWVRGSGSKWRPSPNGPSTQVDCDALEPGSVLSWQIHEESFHAGGLNGQPDPHTRLLRAVPDNSVTNDTDVTVNIGVTTGGLGGAVGWSFNNGEVWILTDHAPPVIADWRNDFPTGFIIPNLKHSHPACPGDPSPRQGNRVYLTRGTEGNGYWSSWPGAQWITPDRWLRLGIRSIGALMLAVKDHPEVGLREQSRCFEPTNWDRDMIFELPPVGRAGLLPPCPPGEPDTYDLCPGEG